MLSRAYNAINYSSHRTSIAIGLAVLSIVFLFACVAIYRRMGRKSK